VFAATSDDQKLHPATTPADFAALGLGQTIAVREDGRRTQASADTFEWRYFDGLLDDGTVVVVWFGDNWFYGLHQRAVSIEIGEWKMIASDLQLRRFARRAVAR
jgi:hypothetical protein